MITIKCPHCKDIHIPEPEDLGMLKAFLNAHGATHGEDWRTTTDSIMALIAYQLEVRKPR